MAPSIWGGRNDRRDISNAVGSGEPGLESPEITLDFCIWLQTKGFDEIIEELNGKRSRVL